MIHRDDKFRLSDCTKCRHLEARIGILELEVMNRDLSIEMLREKRKEDVAEWYKQRGSGVLR
jgi:hypothetical protein